MADQATIKAPAAIAACILFLIIGAAIGFLFAGSGGGGGTAGGTGSKGSGVPDETVFQNPLSQVEVGEWAIYDRGKGHQLQFEVVEVDPATGALWMLQQDWDREENKSLGSSRIPVHPNHFLWSHDRALYVVSKVYPERIEAAGRTFDCLCVEMVSRVRATLRTWYSADIPVVGMVRQQTVAGPHAGFVNAEITNWSGR